MLSKLSIPVIVAVSLVGLSGMVVAALGPILGFGSAEEFLFFELLGMRRRQFFANGGTLFFLAFVAFITYASFFPLNLENKGFLPSWIGLTLRRMFAVPGQALAFHRNWAVFLALVPVALYAFGFLIFAMPDVAVLSPDSRDYIRLDPARTIGYPLFLRISALIVDDPYGIILIQFTAGVLAILFFAESLARLIRAFLVPFLAGAALMLNWPLTLHAANLLTDYPFFTVVCWHFGLFCLILRKPTPPRFFLLAFSIGLAVSLRPVGLFLATASPLLLFVYPALWRSVLGYFVVPLFAMCVLIAAGHWAVFDYFGLSRFGGHVTTANTMMLLTEDTETDHPELTRRLLDLGTPYKKTYGELETRWDKFLFLVSASARIGEAFDVLQEYVRKHPDRVVLSDTSRQEYFYRFLGRLSDLNRRMSRMPVAARPYWNSHDEILAAIAVDAHLSNLPMLLETLLVKFTSWGQLISVKLVPDDLVFHSYRPEIAGYGFNEPDPSARLRDGVFFNRTPYNVAAIVQFGYEKIVWGHFLAFVVGVGCVALVVLGRVRHVDTDIRIRIAALAYFFVALFSYVLLISIAQAPLPRYLMVLLPATLVLVLSPILALESYCRHPRWQRFLDHLSPPPGRP